MPAPEDTWRQVARDALAELDRSALVLLLLAVCMPVVYVYQGVPIFFLDHLAWTVLPGDPLLPLYAQLWRFGSVFVLFFVVPALAYRLLARRPLADLGLRPGGVGPYLRIVLPAAVVLGPLLWISSAGADFQAEYPMAKVATQSSGLFAAYLLAYSLYYWGWEFFFRGALQLGLRSALGLTGSLMVQMLPSVLLHIGKPLGETWSAVLAAPLFGAVAVRSGSFVPLFVLHWIIGVQNDVFCAVRQGLL